MYSIQLFQLTLKDKGKVNNVFDVNNTGSACAISRARGSHDKVLDNNSDRTGIWKCSFFLGDQGWHGGGESTRLLPMWLGFDSQTRRHMWVEFVGGSRPCSERFFSGYSGWITGLTPQAHPSTDR